MSFLRIKLIYPPPDLNYCNLPYGAAILTEFLKKNNYRAVLDDLAIKVARNNRLFTPFSLKYINLNLLKKYELNKIIEWVSGRYHDLHIDRISDKLFKLVDCKGYNLLGISVTDNYFQFVCALLLLKKIRSTTNAKVVLGGAFITIYGKEVFPKLDIIDYIILGDGQIPLIKFIEYLEGRINIEEVPNLLYRKDRHPRENKRQFYPLEEMAIPDFSDVPLATHKTILPARGRVFLSYQISRGCVGKCSFCQLSIINPYLDFKSHDKVISELKIMKERYNTKSFLLISEAINCSYKYLDKFCDLLIKEKLDIIWMASARPDNLDKNILQKMKIAGCLKLLYGVESGSNRVLKSIGKGFNVCDASRVLKESHRAGIRNTVFLIVGYPYENRKDISLTVKFIKENANYVNRYLLFPVTISNGAPLYDHPANFGIKNLRMSQERIFRSYSDICFAFDEINGLKWDEKLRQRKYFADMIHSAIAKYTSNNLMVLNEKV